MKEREQYKLLLDKYLKSNITDSEKDLFYQYLRNNDFADENKEVLEKLWNEVDEKKLSKESSDKIIKEIILHYPYKKQSAYSWYKMAAVITGLLVTAFFVYKVLFSSTTIIYTTGFGQIKEITLPDQSTVILNSNSQLTFQSDWGRSKERNVWLVGEAYFQVKKQPDLKKFKVLTGNQEVEVIGTAFNVNNRRGKVQVVLNSGKVKLNTLKAEAIFLNPGDMVELTQDDGSIINKKIVEPEEYSAFRMNMLIFKEKPLRDILRQIEDNYGYETDLQNKEMEKLTFTGAVPSLKMEILLKTISESYNLKIEVSHDKKIIILK